MEKDKSQNQGVDIAATEKRIEVVSALPGEPDYLVPVNLVSLFTSRTEAMYQMRYWRYDLLARPPSIKDYSKAQFREVMNEIIYWDESKSSIYVEALAFFKDTEKLVRFRKHIETELHINEFPCQTCGRSKWKARNVDVKTVPGKKGRRWKCFSVIFVCSDCLANKRVSERSIRMQGWKHALIKAGGGVKDLFDRIRKVTITGDLSTGSGSATLDLGDKKIGLKRCPLLQ